MVLIDKLRIHTVDELCLCLDKVPTLGWKKLMHKGLNRIYENDDIRFIDSSKQLLDDLKGRGKSVEDLMDALSRIGNEKAVTIILQGMKEIGLPIQATGDSGRSRQPIETSQKMHSTSQRSFPSENERVVSGMKEIGLPIQATGDSGRDSRQPMENSTEEPSYLMTKPFMEPAETLLHPVKNKDDPGFSQHMIGLLTTIFPCFLAP